MRAKYSKNRVSVALFRLTGPSERSMRWIVFSLTPDPRENSCTLWRTAARAIRIWHAAKFLFRRGVGIEFWPDFSSRAN